MSLILCPTLIEFVEFNMLSSKAFIDGEHKVLSIWIRNHSKRKEKKNNIHSTHTLPKSMFDPAYKNLSHDYNHRINEVHEIKFKVTGLDRMKGIEKLQRFIAKEHPDFDFYLLELITQTMNKHEHVCTWTRCSSSGDDSKVPGLQLTHIDGKDVYDHFREGQMWEIVGGLPEDACEIEEKTVQVRRPICRTMRKRPRTM